ncbi:MAG: hypothetical protein COU63_05085, partial [Candidatus Pacebacteria bacterium CG10_big_fil_rev_8_21_14_0_10_36_11]
MTDWNKKPLAEMPETAKKESSSVPQFSQSPIKKSDPKKTIFAILGLVSFFILGVAGVLISQKQYLDKNVTAPNAPGSQPAAYINKASCHLTFTVGTPTTVVKTACGFSPCETDNDCIDGLSCVTSSGDSIGEGAKYCSQPEFEDACILNPGVDACCTEPTPVPGECAAECVSDTDCDTGLTCVGP